jgi:hypothetical protein
MNAADEIPADAPAATGCTRRSFLLATLAGALGAGALAGCSAPADSGTWLQKWSAWLLSNNANRDAVVRLGKSYLQAYPAEGDRTVLLAEIDSLIAANLETGSLEAAGPREVGAVLERAVRAEYAAGTVVAVNGWVLSVTEGRLYAAVALVLASGAP